MALRPSISLRLRQRACGLVRGALGVVVCTFLLASCATYSKVQHAAPRITPYRITIVQGNFVSRAAAAQLRPGMSREQVRAILGTPLLTDLFHANRWDYIFYFKRGAAQVVQRRALAVYFDGDRVLRWEGDADLPSEYELIAEIDGDKQRKRGAQKANTVQTPMTER